MIKVQVVYGRGKPFERDNVTKILYANDDGVEVTVEGDDLLTHRFPTAKDLVVYAEDGMSSVSCQGLRAISAFEIQEK